MAQLNIDRIDTLSAKESHGIVRQLTRKARIIFQGVEVTNNNTYDILASALSLLDTEGYGAMSTLTPLDDPTRRRGALVLVRREPTLAFPDSTNCVDVVLDYQHVLDGPNQEYQPIGSGDALSGIGTFSGSVFGKGRCSIVDKTTNFFYPNGDRTQPKTQITVAHQFPLWETGIAASAFNPLFPRTILQGGEISIPFPQSNYSFSAIVVTDNPTGLANFLVASINSVPLMGQPELTWICSEVKWECNAPAGNPFLPATSYNMSFEFQNNSDGWDPTVVFLDHRTSRPPANVEFANYSDPADPNNVLNQYADPSLPLGAPGRIRPAAIWNVPALRRIDFVNFFNTLFR